MAPMTRNKAPNGILTEEAIDYYTARAKGGVGLIITEGTCISDSAHGYPDTPSFYGDYALAMWEKVVNSVCQCVTKIIPQLWHVGSIRLQNVGPTIEAQSLGPSAVSHPYLEQNPKMFAKPKPPKLMSKKNIEDTILDYTAAAVSASKIGCAGIELHAAHGYLIDQFFWSLTNRRMDRFGGKKLGSRSVFAQEIIKSIRTSLKEFPIIMRISQWKLGDFTAKNAHTPRELESQLIPLVQAGVDIFHCSTHHFDQPIFEGSDLSYAGWVKKISGKPVIAVGGIGLTNSFVESFNKEPSKQSSLDNLMSALDREEFDLVALGRPLLSDPDWPDKVKQGKFDEIIPFSPKYLP